MKIINRIGWAFWFFSVALGIVSPILSATNRIGVRSELLTYPLLLLVNLFGVVLINVSKTPNATKNLAAIWFSGVLFVSAFLFLILCWKKSDEVFTFWTLQIKSQREWDDLKSSLENVKTQKDIPTDSTGVSLSPDDVPKEFDRFWRRSDYAYGSVELFPDYPDKLVYLAYGFKTRRWGLYAGPLEGLKEKFSHATRKKLGENYYLFIGPDT